MSRTWAELLGDAEGAADEEERGGFLTRLRDSLSKSRRALVAELGASFDPAAEDSWEQLEVALIRADVGVTSTAELVRRLEARGEVTDLVDALADEVEALFGDPPTLAAAPEAAAVVLVVGVNGTGKTTTIGKLARKLGEHGRSVLVGAADTFRAAAEEQLEIWAERAAEPATPAPHGSDPASLAFDARARADAEGADLLLIETAGRLQNRGELMAELGKIIRAVKKLDPSAPHATLLVLDATVGQNAISQVDIFGKTAGVTGLVMTKLDGTARGGILVAIADKFGLPIHFVGVGESIDDLEPFAAKDFARALVGLDT